LFNHESPRRGQTFVTRKITRAVANILIGRQKKLFLGNLNARRDWGYAPDYVNAMWMMLQHGEPDDFVIATGESHSVMEFLEEAFRHAGLNWQDYVEIDPIYFRPTEIEHLVGDAAKAREVLGWRPSVSFRQLVKIMVDADISAAKKEAEFLRDRNE
jgi:GDPmannose 4,6-dehydratase